ncbi:MAG: rhodanese-like domain-containing protein [Weeksellaceae bacterium]
MKLSLKDFFQSFQKRSKENKTFVIVISVIASLFLLIALWIAFGPRYSVYNRLSRQQVADFWALQKTLYVDPNVLIQQMSAEKKTIILVDIRAAEDYKKAHILDAVNIPVAFDAKTNSIKKDADLKKGFKKLGKNQEIIIYGENSYSQIPETVAFNLGSEGIPVQVLTIGFNEFRHFSTFWLPEKLWGKVRVEDFITGETVE